jgi:hypothetical protein
MTGTSCAFILTKSLDLPLYYFHCFFVYNYAVIDNLAQKMDTIKHLVLMEDSTQEMLDDLLQA